MKYTFLFASLAATALMATPASAQKAGKETTLAAPVVVAASPNEPNIVDLPGGPTVAENNGQLATHINADVDIDADPTIVYGSTGNAASDVMFDANTAVNITGGGFALIDDIEGDGTDFMSLVINPNDGFSQLDFSIQLETDGSFLLEYDLGLGAGFQQIGTITQVGSSLFDYLIDGTGAGLVFDAIRITSTVPIDFEKQNSITLASNMNPGVPEPGTWAMMLLGFGGMGFALRRSRRKSGALMQIA